MENQSIAVTYGEILQFVGAARQYINQKDTRPSYLTQALSKSIKLLKPHVDAAEDLKVDAKIDLAKKDKDGVIEIHENGAYKMTADGAKKLQAAFREIDRKRVEIEPYYAKIIPSTLDLGWIDLFHPIAIKDYPEPIEE